MKQRERKGLKVVMRFGGISVGDGKKIGRVVKLIESSVKAGTSPIVVVSAMAGVTDSLIEITSKAVKGDQKGIMSFVETLTRHHKDAAKEVIHNESLLEQALLAVDQLAKELERVLISISYLREATPRSQDYILSFGRECPQSYFALPSRTLDLRRKASLEENQE